MSSATAHVSEPFQPEPASKPRPAKYPLAMARKMMADYFDAITVDALAFHRQKGEQRDAPRQSALRVTTGAGKSHFARKMLADYVRAARAEGLPHRVLFLVPTHQLAEEARKRMEMLGVSTAIWQSRKAKDVETGEPLCRNLDAVKAAEDIGVSVETAACRQPRQGQEPLLCPFFDTCAYQKQKAVAAEADVVFAAHEVGFYGIPKPLGTGFGLVVIDESFWQDGLRSTSLLVDGLARGFEEFPVRGFDDAVQSDDTARLLDITERLRRALDKHPVGYVSKAALLEAGLLAPDGYEAGSATDAAKLEWRRKVDPKLSPETSPDERGRIAQKFALLGQLPRRAWMWNAVNDLLSGTADIAGMLRIEERATKEGTARRIVVQGMRPLHETVAALPVVHLDATMSPMIVRRFLPRLEEYTDPATGLPGLEVETPHARITQVTGIAVGKSSLMQREPGRRRGGEEDRVGNKRNRLRTFVEHEARDRTGCVITYADIEPSFAGIPGVSTGHFNAIQGLDGWRDVDVLVVIGRPMARVEDIERLTAALFGVPVTLPRKSDAVEGNIQLRNGSAVPLVGWDGKPAARRFEDEAADAVRAAITEAEIVQAIGRGRATGREAVRSDDAAGPLQTFLICHDVAPVEVDEVRDFAELEPSKADEMLARGFLPKTPAHAVLLYPDLFGSMDAARKAYQRGLATEAGSRAGTFPYKSTLIRECPTPQPALIQYTLEGRGQQQRSGLARRDALPGLRERLEARLGPLKVFEIVEPEVLGVGREAANDNCACGTATHEASCPLFRDGAKAA